MSQASYLLLYAASRWLAGRAPPAGPPPTTTAPCIGPRRVPCRPGAGAGWVGTTTARERDAQPGCGHRPPVGDLNKSCSGEGVSVNSTASSPSSDPLAGFDGGGLVEG